MSDYTGYERDLDYTEAVFLALIRIPPGVNKTIREIHRCVVALTTHSRSCTPRTETTREMVEWALRNLGGYLPGYEITHDAAGQVTGVKHEGTVRQRAR